MHRYGHYRYNTIQYNRQKMYNPLSTRNRTDKTYTLKFFKKLSHNDENERNAINGVDRPMLKSCHSTKNIISVGHSLHSLHSESKTKMFSKKKSTVPTVTISKNISKGHIGHINLASNDHPHHSSQHSKILRKQSSTKQLKLGSTISSELPLLAKSASQTTMHRKMDENKLKLLQKLGGVRKRSQKQSFLNIHRFKLGKKLGSGRFGNVYLAEEKSTRTLYALKVMSKSKIKEADMVDQVFWEIKLQTYMNHPNILKMYGFFHDAKNIYLILEYCSQCLFRDFRAKTRLSEEQTAYYGKQVTSALKYMHNESIIHRDIKPENIMINFGVLKMSDFGWSTYAPTYKRQTFCGTVDYVPPQIVQGSQYDERVDIWALGILLYELAAGKAPFETKDENITYDKIVNCQCQFPSHFSRGLKEVVGKILDKNPERRPNLEQIEGESWFEKYKSVGRYISRDIWAAWSEVS